MKLITVKGNTYNSISAAWRGEKSPVPEVTVRWRLKNGWLPNEAFSYGTVPAENRWSCKSHRLEERGLNLGG